MESRHKAPDGIRLKLRMFQDRSPGLTPGAHNRHAMRHSDAVSCSFAPYRGLPSTWASTDGSRDLPLLNSLCLGFARAGIHTGPRAALGFSTARSMAPRNPHRQSYSPGGSNRLPSLVCRRELRACTNSRRACRPPQSSRQTGSPACAGSGRATVGHCRRLRPDTTSRAGLCRAGSGGCRIPSEAGRKAGGGHYGLCGTGCGRIVHRAGWPTVLPGIPHHTRQGILSSSSPDPLGRSARTCPPPAHPCALPLLHPGQRLACRP
jgi:hypothetical protein